MKAATLAYSFVETVVAMHPYYIARAIGGMLFLIGALIACYNIWMTIRTADQPADQRLGRPPVPALAGAAAPQPAE
jgi:cytochrome c oxidase cbb3-type subunit 1